MTHFSSKFQYETIFEISAASRIQKLTLKKVLTQFEKFFFENLLKFLTEKTLIFCHFSSNILFNEKVGD